MIIKEKGKKILCLILLIKVLRVNLWWKARDLRMNPRNIASSQALLLVSLTHNKTNWLAKKTADLANFRKWIQNSVEIVWKMEKWKKEWINIKSIINLTVILVMNKNWLIFRIKVSIRIQWKMKNYTLKSKSIKISWIRKKSGEIKKLTKCMKS